MNFCVMQRVTVVVKMLCDRETRQYLCNTLEVHVLAKPFPQSALALTYIDGLAATEGNAVNQIGSLACKGFLDGGEAVGVLQSLCWRCVDMYDSEHVDREKNLLEHKVAFYQWCELKHHAGCDLRDLCPEVAREN